MCEAKDDEHLSRSIGSPDEKAEGGRAVLKHSPGNDGIAEEEEYRANGGEEESAVKECESRGESSGGSQERSVEQSRDVQWKVSIATIHNDKPDEGADDLPGEDGEPPSGAGW